MGAGEGGPVAGGVPEEENLADILENHELRRWGEVPGGVCLSMEFERDTRLGAVEPFEPFGVEAWPLCELFESTEALSEAGGFGLEFAPGICRGRAAEGVFVGGEFLVILSLEAPWVIQLTSTP
jgi:hypothetical protein